MKKEMYEILNKLIWYCVSKYNQKIIQELISNEVFHDVELTYRTSFIDTMW